jgi:Domain of unknown function (DUF4386)
MPAIEGEVMSTEGITATAVDSGWRAIYRTGGISAIILGASYIVITALYILAGAVPSGGGKDWLDYVVGQQALWWAIVALSVLTDILFVPVSAALYVALKPVNRNAMLVGIGFLVLFVVLDLAVTWPNYAALITLSGAYGAAADEPQRTAQIAAANYPSAVLTSSLFAIYAILVPSLGILVIGLVMLRGTFSRTEAYLGVLTGILGIISVVGPFFASALGTVVIITSVLTTVWILLVGYRLIRLGQLRFLPGTSSQR